ncbi:hypothetical protein, partial [Mesorhizobium sp. M3A.F.Ca.ET.175.01.1.1]
MEFAFDLDLADDLESENVWFPLTIEVEGDAGDALERSTVHLDAAQGWRLTNLDLECVLHQNACL